MRGRTWIVVATVTAAAAVGYGTADAYGIVPGFLTNEPAPEPQPAFLSASPVAATPGPVEVPMPVSPEAPEPDAAAIQALALAVRADSRTGASTNVSVVDYLTGDVLADVGAVDPQVPASTTKLLTAIAAVAALGPDFTTHTDVLWDGKSTLTLVAGGDAMLAAGAGHGGSQLDETGRPDANGWAGIADLAAQVAAAIGEGERGELTVVVDDSAFPGAGYPPAWPEYALTLGYAGPVTGLAVNVGKKKDALYAPRYADPSVAAGQTLVRALRVAGLTASSTVEHGNAGGAVAATVESAPLSAVATEFLTYSDNTVAETVSRVAARETGRAVTPAGAAVTTKVTLARMGVDVNGLRLYDGAGFSNKNQIAPAHMTAALVAARSEPHTADLLAWLPLAGLEGTLDTRFRSDSAAGFMRGKSGSLTGVTALTGVVTTLEGRMLAYAVLADGMAPGQAKPIAAIDAFVNALARCGCEVGAASSSAAGDAS